MAVKPAAAPRRPTLLVLAGVNGGGKSSVAGAWLREQALDYYNPDEATTHLRQQGLDAPAANAAAWEFGRRGLSEAIEHGRSFAIETTLGGSTIPALVHRATDSHDVTLWFVGLDTPERHLSRIRERVERGGHDIPEPKVRQRWDGARRNLIALMPRLFELRVYDNSREVRNAADARPVLLLHLKQGHIVAPPRRLLERTPEWAKPLVQAAHLLQAAGEQHGH
jgi:predicted ABC-type ATPase